MKVKNKSYLYQHGTLGGLMQDLMDGTEQIGKMLEYGNFGIGEVIILDGEIYHVDESGKVRVLQGNEGTPYAAVVDFSAAKHLQISQEMTDEEVKNHVLTEVSPNLFSAVKIHGVFAKMHVRVDPKQDRKYQRNDRRILYPAVVPRRCGCWFPPAFY